MDPSKILEDKVVLVVDDEPDVLETITDILDSCLITQAGDFETARQYLMSYTYDIVIFDIMGVNGFELLKMAVKRKFPAVMISDYALTPASLEKAIRIGAVTFLPKEKMGELDIYLADVVLGGNKPRWERLFRKMGGFFNQRFGLDWKTRNRFFADFERSLNKNEDPEEGQSDETRG